MQKKLNWRAFSSGNRHKVIGEVQDIISSNDGCIVNFNMFSDLALSLSIEIEECRIVNLYNALDTVINIEGFDDKNINKESKKELLLFMNLSFSQGSGKLKTDIPDVPG